MAWKSLCVGPEGAFLIHWFANAGHGRGIDGFIGLMDVQLRGRASLESLILVNHTNMASGAIFLFQTPRLGLSNRIGLSRA